MGYALYTTHERPFFFNQSISTGKNFFRFEVSIVNFPEHYSRPLLAFANVSAKFVSLADREPER